MKKSPCFITFPWWYEHEYIIWLLEIEAKRNNSWLSQNIHTRNNRLEKTVNAHNQDEQTEKLIHIAPCTDRLQYFCKQMQDKSRDEIHFEIICVPI